MSLRSLLEEIRDNYNGYGPPPYGSPAYDNAVKALEILDRAEDHARATLESHERAPGREAGVGVERRIEVGDLVFLIKESRTIVDAVEVEVLGVGVVELMLARYGASMGTLIAVRQ